MDQLEAHEVPIYKVFSSDYDFSIPDYQRPYAWEVEQASQLLEDLTEALDRGDDEPYFLGSIVLVKQKESSVAEVIDGQQRLTTVTILLATLRDLSESPELQAEIDSMLREPGSIVQGLEKKPRLTLRKRDRKFFHDHVQEAQSIAGLSALDTRTLATDSQRAICRNARAFLTELSKWTPERRLELTQMLGKRTFLVVVSTPDLASAHRIFSVMNARGLDLSPADIFKAQVVGAIDETDSTAYTERWEDAEDLLGRDAFAELFQHIRMIYAKVKGRRELLKEFPDQVLDQYLPTRAREFVDGVLEPYAMAYSELQQGSYAAPAGADLVNAWFRRLAQIDNFDWRPAALWALTHHHDDAAWLNAFLERLERLAASMFIRRVYTTPRIARYADLLTELDDGLGLDAPALALSDAERSETLSHLSGEVYRGQKTRRYILLRLDEALANDPGVTYSHSLITVEHVLPQTPEEGSDWMADFSDEEREMWTHRLANLVLLNQKKNSEAGRLSFAEKKQKYFTSKHGVAAFALTTQVLSHEIWTPDVLNQRQGDLVAKLAALWRLT